MYIERGAAGFDAMSLRQGDILAGIPFPLMDAAKMQILGTTAPEYPFNGLPVISPTTIAHREDPQWVLAQVPVRFCLCAVLSNCCDIEPRGGGRPQGLGVNLARLREISVDIRNNAARFQSLTANKDPRSADPGYIDYFYLQPHDLLDGRDWRVHYSQSVTIPISDFALLLRKKILQLNDRERMKFKIKLAATYGRANDDELEAGLENPWLEQNAPQAAAPAAQPPAPAVQEPAPAAQPPARD